MKEIKQFFEQDNVKAKFVELLGKRAPQFITSVLQITASNSLLANADPMSVYNAAATAATLDLPINNNLGFAYIVPYNQKQPDGSYKQVAQCQISYRGFTQLALRSGQFQTISASPIYEGQLASSNPLLGYVFDFEKKTSDKIIGFAAYFRLLNGFEKTFYMTTEQLKAHGLKYSQTYKKKYGLWETDFDAMALKTVIKLLLSKFAPLSIEMQKAVLADQGIITALETAEEPMQVEYIDNDPDAEKKEQADKIQNVMSEGK